MASICLSSAQVCRVRATRIQNCAFVRALTGAVIADCVVRVSADPDYEAGEDLIMKDGCGKICAALKTCDQLKRMNVEIELATRNLPLLEILTGGRILTNDEEPADMIGFARRALGSPCPNPSSLEIWSKAIDAGGDCDANGIRWFRTALPKATLTLGGFVYANEIATVKMTGYVEALPGWDTGPFEDWPDPAGLGDAEVEAFIIDAAGPPALPSTCTYTTSILTP